eukprot:TRINITY_DN20818_c0_g1_i2.p1 TRINITY_DN20818_c0_g1~~TRINITY_DN20818_c0_g1_i2.p1  ORF type:complete len:749 (+),score=134.95 TRINITY_DN20818_c0_g1_i2:56-2302(+)
MPMPVLTIACFLLAIVGLADDNGERKWQEKSKSKDKNKYDRIDIGQIHPGVSCKSFYTTPFTGEEFHMKQDNLRSQNVRSMVQKFPYIRLLKTLHWKGDWQLVLGFYKKLGIRVKLEPLRKTYTNATRGKLCHWAVFLIATAWQSRFDHECMLLMEDDVKLPDNFNQSFKSLTMERHRPKILKFGDWGEGYVFNADAATRFLVLALKEGIQSSTDWFIINNINRELVQNKIRTKLLVTPNQGSIASSPLVQDQDVGYQLLPWFESLRVLMGVFTPKDAHHLDLVDIVKRVSSSNASSPIVIQSAPASPAPTLPPPLPPLEPLPCVNASDMHYAGITLQAELRPYKALEAVRSETPSLMASFLQAKPTCFDGPWRALLVISVVGSVAWAFLGYWSSGPVVMAEIISYLSLLATIQFSLKYLYGPCSFAHPQFVTASHFLLSGLFGLGLNIITSSLTLPTAKEFFCLVLPIAGTFAISTLMTNTALRYCSISYVQMIGSTTPMVSAGMTICMGMPFSRWLFLATAVVAAGAALSIRGSVDVSWLGTFLAFGANITRALKGTLQQYIMTGELKKKFTPPTLLTWSCFASTPLMLGISLCSEGTAPWKKLITYSSPVQLFTALFLSCMNAVGLNLFSLIITKEVGAVGTQIVGQIKTMLAFIGGIVVFKECATPFNIVGLLIVLLGAGTYQRWNQQLNNDLKKVAATTKAPSPKDQVRKADKVEEGEDSALIEKKTHDVKPSTVGEPRLPAR